MAVVSYLYRRGARYHYRRRLYLRKILSEPISIGLGTADPAEARRLVARLSVRWDQTVMQIQMEMRRGTLRAEELTAVFRAGLDEELALATAPRFDPAGDDALDQRPLRIFEAAYRIAARIQPDTTTLDPELLARHTAELDERDRQSVVLMLKCLSPHQIAAVDAKRILAAIDAPVTPTTVRDARVQLLLGRAEAQVRATLLEHPGVASSGDPLTHLLDDSIISSIRYTAPVANTAQDDTPFMTADTRRFSEVIPSTIAAIQKSGDWNEDIAQRKRVIESFCWTTEDKRLCDYRPQDARHFADTLEALPTEFRWGTPKKGAMSRPFQDVMAEVATAGGTSRSNRTFNRDLTTMARFGRELMKTAWKPRYGKDPIIDFNAFTAASPEHDPNDPDRMPWTEDQLITLFSSPVYTGGGACARRFKTGATPVVWHDAAYWVPLLLDYGIMSREEACGLECHEFVFDVPTPFVAVMANMTKSKDGTRPAGLKRKARYRMLPLHPELLRLGLREYVEAIEAEGHSSIFPELYQSKHVKRGGVRFYASAGRYHLHHVDGITPLLRTSAGKRADLHSIRTTGGSELEDSDAKQLLVDDIMGHQREGVGPRKYSKAWFVKGGAKILLKRLKTMVRALPNVTRHLEPVPIRLLPIAERSRTGSSVGCASRKSA